MIRFYLIALLLIGCSTPLPRRSPYWACSPERRVNIAVYNRAEIPDAEFRRAVSAVQVQLDRDFAPAWGIHATLLYRAALTDAAPDRIVSVEPGPSSWGPLGTAWEATGAIVRTSRCVRFGVPWTRVLSHEIIGMLGGEQPGHRDICDTANERGIGYSVDGVALSGFDLPDGEIFDGR